MTEIRAKKKNWTGSSSRRKGHGWERECAEKFREFFAEARRGLAQTRNAGETCDVEGTPFWVEAKRGNVQLMAALKQARAQTDGRVPLVIGKFDHEKPFVAMHADDFFRLLESLYPRLVLAEVAKDVDPDGDEDDKG
jgi:hypothetical protein